MDKRKKIAITLNFIIFALAVIGSIMTFFDIRFIDVKVWEHGIKELKFFTVQSNIFAGIISLVFAIYLILEHKTNKPVPKPVHILKFMVTVDLVITFLVVALLLGFFVEDGYYTVFVNSNLFFHLIIPILNFISFAFFEDVPNFSIKYTFFGIIHLTAYSIFYLIVVLTHYNDGGIDIYYDWYAFAQLGLPMAFVFAFIILSLGYLVSYITYKINKIRFK